MELVSCGRAFPGHEIAIVAPDGRAPRRARGGRDPAARPERDRRLLRRRRGHARRRRGLGRGSGGGWLRTGRPRLSAPAASSTSAAAPRISSSSTARTTTRRTSSASSPASTACATGSASPSPASTPTGAEIAVVVAESRKNTAGIADAILAAVRCELGLTIGEVYFIKRGTLPKTSSGKVRRRECRRRLEELELELVSESDADSVDTRAAARASAATPAPRASPAPFRPAALQGAPAWDPVRPRSRSATTSPTSSSGLWLDERMNYTSAVFESETQSLEAAQLNKLRILSDFAQRHARAQHARHRLRLGRLPGVPGHRARGEARRRRHAVHCPGRGGQRPQAPRRGVRRRRLHEVGDEGALRRPRLHLHDRPPLLARRRRARARPSTSTAPTSRSAGSSPTPARSSASRPSSATAPPRCGPGAPSPADTRKDLEDYYFCTKDIFPGGLNPRLEELIQAVNPYFEVLQCHTRRRDYQRTTAEWLRRLRLNEKTIRDRVGGQGLRRLRSLPRPRVSAPSTSTTARSPSSSSRGSTRSMTTSH